MSKDYKGYDEDYDKETSKNGSDRGKSGKYSTSGSKSRGRRNKRSSRNGNTNYSVSNSSRNRSGSNGRNDSSWYTVTSQLVQDTASIPYTYPVGRQVPTPFDGIDSIDTVDRAYRVLDDRVTIPGVARVGISLIPGECKNVNSPINVAARSLYSYIRHANSGSKNYDPTNLMQYLMCADQIYAMMAHFMRAYGTISVYSQLNSYLPDKLLRVMGFDANDLRANYAQFRAFINMCCARINSLAIPDAFTIFKRHFFMYNNIYRDSSNEKSQLYVIVPDTYAYYDEFSTPGRGCVQYAKLKTADLTTNAGRTGQAMPVYMVDEWEAILNDMINRMLNSEDVGIISGDILKAYGSNLLVMAPIEESYTVMPVYEPEFLEQLHNATIVGTPIISEGEEQADDPSFQIVENTALESGSFLYSNWYTTMYQDIRYDHEWNSLIVDVSYYAAHKTDLVSTRLGNPDATSTMVDTRLKSMGRVIDSEGSILTDSTICDWDAIGSELVHSITYCAQHEANGSVIISLDDLFRLNSNVIPHIYESRGVTAIEDCKDGMAYNMRISYMLCFDWYPEVWLVNDVKDWQSDDHFLQDVHPMFDVDGYAIITKDVLKNIHTVATLSLYNIPVSGSWGGNSAK